LKDPPKILSGLIRRTNATDIFALIFIVGFFAYLFFYTNESFRTAAMPENPVLNILLGSLATCFALVIQYYFREFSTDDTVKRAKEAEES